MIFYFTSTGNSLEVAQITSSITGDRMADLGLAYKKGRFDVYVEQGEALGFVFPVYYWTTPAIVDDFITSNGKPFVPGYCYCILTCGLMAGSTADFLAKLLREHHGIRLDASFSVKSVSNNVALYDMPSEAEQKATLREARRQAKAIAYLVRGKRMEHSEVKNLAGQAFSLVTSRKSKHHDVSAFRANGSCTGCGTCAIVCPTNTVSMESGRPAWRGDECTFCLACIQRCPAHAAQYGGRTARRGRYVNPVLATRPIQPIWTPPEVPTGIDPRAEAAMLPDLRRGGDDATEGDAGNAGGAGADEVQASGENEPDGEAQAATAGAAEGDIPRIDVGKARQALLDPDAIVDWGRIPDPIEPSPKAAPESVVSTDASSGSVKVIAPSGGKGR